MKELDSRATTSADDVAKIINKLKIKRKDIQAITCGGNYIFVYFWKDKGKKKK